MKNNVKKTLTEREKYFCYYYVNTGNLREAATLAGYSGEPEKKGIKLFSKDSIKEEIERLYNEKRKNLVYKAYIGYERLAFGNVADSIRLLYLERPDKINPENMNLFNISEIKRPKDGSMEIKFFDRIRALEKLEQSDSGEKSSVSQFYYAMDQGIKALAENNRALKED